MLDKIMGFIPLNFDLMKNPVNWIIITMMVLLAGIALAFVMKSTQVSAD